VHAALLFPLILNEGMYYLLPTVSPFTFALALGCESELAHQHSVSPFSLSLTDYYSTIVKSYIIPVDIFWGWVSR